MMRAESQHHTEEDLLMYLLGEETFRPAGEIEGHVAECGECAGVLSEYRALLSALREWELPELPEADWNAQKARLLAFFRLERDREPHRAFWYPLLQALDYGWNYALENPLPTMAFVAAATAFALERTISVFALDRLLPVTGELIEILRQVL